VISQVADTVTFIPVEQPAAERWNRSVSAIGSMTSMSTLR
jgi:hypothetical protein